MNRRNFIKGLGIGILGAAFGIYAFKSYTVPTQAESAQGTQETSTSAVPVEIGGKSVKLNSGYEIPTYGLGTYSLHGETCKNSVKAALACGVRLIDTAHAYGNEVEIGEAIRESGVPREEIFVTTKIYPDQFDDPVSAIEEALRKLNIGYIDLMLLHHPGRGDIEVYKTIEQYITKGKVHSVGLSCYYIKELQNFLPKVSIKPALVQNEIHPYYQDKDVVPYIQGQGIAVQGWYPLGGRGHNRELMREPILQRIAEAHNKSLVQIILRWNLQRGVIVIPGSSNPQHIKENTEIFDFALTDEEMADIAKLDRHEKHDWY